MFSIDLDSSFWFFSMTEARWRIFESDQYFFVFVSGYTDFNEQDLDEILHGLSQQWHGKTYHLVTRNCNHFSDQLAQLLCGQEVPSWINRVANMSARVPFLQRCLPQEWLTPVALDVTIEDMVGEDLDMDRLHQITFCNRIPEHLRRASRWGFESTSLLAIMFYFLLHFALRFGNRNAEKSFYCCWRF